MNSILYTTNAISFLFIVVILFSLYLVPKDVFKITKAFRYSMWVCVVGLIVEMLAFYFGGKNNVAVFVTNYLGYLLINVLVIFYGFFFIKVISDYEPEFKKKYEKLFLFNNTGLCIANILFVTVGAFTGKLFAIESGYYVGGPWEKYATILPGICFLIDIILYGVKYKAFRLTNRLIILVFVIIPAGIGVFMYVDPDIRHGFAGAALSLNVIYVLVLSKMSAESVAKEEFLNKISKNDTLTGLKNRFSYQELIDKVGEKEIVGVAFADVNGLKTVNDNQGHQEGDKLIIRAANLLKASLEKGEVFRISGDEFVCIVKGVKDDDFNALMSKVAEAINANDRIMSFGYAIGEGGSILDTVKAAEQMMYGDKERYYKETGKDRRNRRG